MTEVEQYLEAIKIAAAFGLTYRTAAEALKIESDEYLEYRTRLGLATAKGLPLPPKPIGMP